MLKTGNKVIDVMALVSVFLPLIPVFTILLRKTYQRDILNFLMILCLLNFLGSLNLELLQMTPTSLATAEQVFSFLEMVILIQIFKSGLRKKMKGLLDVFVVAFLSAALTYYSLKGGVPRPDLLDFLQDLTIILLSTVTLVLLVRSNYLQIMYSPLFWIASGTLFYFVIALLLEIIDHSGGYVQQSVSADRIVMLIVATTARYFFYFLAAWIYNRPPGSDERPAAH
jgi:hypothetical protein